jgi:hypothetical protein
MVVEYHQAGAVRIRDGAVVHIMDNRYWTVQELATRYGVTRQAIVNRLRRHRTMMSTPRYKRSRNPPYIKRMLTPQDARVMESMMLSYEGPKRDW